MKKSRLLVLPIALLLIFTQCKKEETTSEPSILVGEGITGLKIGGAAQQAIDLYGDGLKSWSNSGSQYFHFVSYLSKGVDVYLETTSSQTFDPQTKVKYLVLSAPFAEKTDKGIGIGSTKTEVEAAYGKPTSSSDFFGDDFSNGLTVKYDDAGTKVEEIEVN